MMVNPRRWTTAAAGFLVLIGAVPVVAEDWPQWRGPGRDGKLRGFVPPKSWNKSTLTK